MNELLLYLGEITLFLCVALLLSRLVSQHAAKAHSILLAAMALVFVLPILTLFVIQYDLGYLTSTSEPAPLALANNTVSPALQGLETTSFEAMMIPPELAITPPIETSVPQDVSTTEDIAFQADTPAISTTRSKPTPVFSFTDVSWTTWMLAIWAFMSALVCWRSAVSTFRAIWIRRNLEPVEDSRLLKDLEVAKAQMGVKKDIRLATHAQASCPMIWCWGTPTIIVPTQPLDSVDWISVFSHELAHHFMRLFV